MILCLQHEDEDDDDVHLCLAQSLHAIAACLVRSESGEIMTQRDRKRKRKKAIAVSGQISKS